MYLMIWRVNRRRGYLFTMLGAILTAFLSHIGCISSLLMVPLGLSGVSIYLERTVVSLKPWILIVPIIFLGLTGWNIYSNPRRHPVEKAAFWISVGVVISLIIV